MNTADVGHFYDFYYLEALSADLARQATSNPELQFRHAFEKLQDDVENYRQKFNELFAENIMNYLWAACLGEARHASTECHGNIITLDNLDGMSRSSVYAKSSKYPINTENLDTLISVYEQDWDSGYGGEAWLKIVEAMKMYHDGVLDAASFIDHCADLEHNGGSAFNKQAEEYTGFDTSNYHDLHEFLTYKFSSDILRELWKDFYAWSVSTKVHSFIVRHNNIIEHKAVTVWLQPRLKPIEKSQIVYGSSILETTEIDDERNYCSYNDHYTNQAVRFINDEYVCLECVHENFTHCVCGHYEHDSNVATIDGSTHCESCAEDIETILCEDCGENVSEWVEHEGAYYCQTCTDANLEYCETHDKYYVGKNVKSAWVSHGCEECEECMGHDVEEKEEWNGKHTVTCHTCEETLENPSEISKTFFLSSHKPLPSPTEANPLQLSLGL